MDLQYIDMGNRIKQRRKALKIKQSELAEMVNISNNHMSSIETGKQKPSIDIFIKICDCLKVTPDYLMLGILHDKNVPRDIIDSLQLCGKDDIELVRKLVEFMVDRNKDNRNRDDYRN